MNKQPMSREQFLKLPRKVRRHAAALARQAKRRDMREQSRLDKIDIVESEEILKDPQWIEWDELKQVTK